MVKAAWSLDRMHLGQIHADLSKMAGQAAWQKGCFYCFYVLIAAKARGATTMTVL